MLSVALPFWGPLLPSTSRRAAHPNSPLKQHQGCFPTHWPAPLVTSWRTHSGFPQDPQALHLPGHALAFHPPTCLLFVSLGLVLFTPQDGLDRQEQVLWELPPLSFSLEEARLSQAVMMSHLTAGQKQLLWFFQTADPPGVSTVSIG